MLSVDLSVSKLPSSLPLCELGCSVFPLPSFLPFPQRPLVDNIRSGQEDAAEERGVEPIAHVLIVRLCILINGMSNATSCASLKHALATCLGQIGVLHKSS